jgi:hypothetical protein
MPCPSVTPWKRRTHAQWTFSFLFRTLQSCSTFAQRWPHGISACSLGNIEDTSTFYGHFFFPRPSKFFVTSTCHMTHTVFYKQRIWLQFQIRFLEILRYIVSLWAAIAQSVQWLTNGWKAQGSFPSGGEIVRTRPDRGWVPPRAGAPPSPLHNGYRVSFPGVKRPGYWRWSLSSI